MAVLTGRQGQIKFRDTTVTDASANAAALKVISALRGWTVNITKDISEAFHMSQGEVNTFGESIGATGTAEVVYDDEADNMYPELVKAVVEGADDGDCFIELYPSAAANMNARKITFAAIITSIDYTAMMNEAQTISINFASTKTITNTLYG